MPSFSLRRSLFGRLFVNLALLLGCFQVLLWHWWTVVVRGEPSPAPGVLLALAGLLVVANRLAVPLLRRYRRRGGWRGHLSRAYMNLGVVTLLCGIIVAAAWLLFLVPAGLIGALGGSPQLAFDAFRIASTAALSFVAVSLLWGFTGGQARVARTYLRVPIPGLASQLDGLRIVHISDLHIGNALEGARLAKLVEQVNAEDADAIVLTGDIFDFDPSFVEEGTRILADLRARHGVYAILGNHDVYTGADQIAAAFARHAPELRLLRDEIVRLPLPAPLYLAGAEDPGRDWAARGLELDCVERMANERPADGPTLLLVHRPQAFGQAVRLGFPLVLAGHTHGGQLALPTRGGHWNLARLVTPLTRGEYRSGGSTLYVNRGLGVGGPSLRVNCSREIATVELKAA
jgi:predicted MPP superfamily phosphohydrolase